MDVSCSKVVRAGRRNELKNESGKDIEHRSKRRVNKGDDGSTASKILLSFFQDVP